VTSKSQHDRTWLLRAVELARGNLETGDGGPFGAVVVHAGRVIGEGANRVLHDHDPTAHAEVVAIRAACAAEGHFHLDGATLYSSCEPCPMCLAAARWAHIERIVFAADRADAAAIGFMDADLYTLFENLGDPSQLPRERLVVPEAQAAMREWVHSPFYVPY
jgi:guanine deaminase